MNTTIRTSNNSILGSLQQTLRNHQVNYSNQQERIAQGKTYLKRSENPSQSDEIARLKNENKKVERWGENASMVLNWEQATQSRIDSTLNYMHRIKELLIEGSNDTLSTDDRINLATEVDGILEGLLQEGNSEFLGVYLFAGTETGDAPFTPTRDGDNRITAMTYNGSTNNRSIQISENSITTEYGLTGTDLFNPSGGVDIFSEMITLRDDLLAGNYPDNTNAENLEDGINQTIGTIIYNTVSQKKLTNLIDNMKSLGQSGMNRLDEIESLDMAEAISALSSMEMAYQASLQMVGRMNQLSLLNYI